MAKREIKSRFGPWEAIKWRFMRGEVVSLPWPKVEEFTVNDKSPGWVDLGGAANVVIYTDCPNHHYRPWLEEKVGEQGKDWMWRHKVGCSVFISPDWHRQIDRLEVKVSKRKSKWASLMMLKWGQR